MELPYFKYHPNPLKTGSIVESQETCECCHKVTGYIYVASVYCKEDINRVCPWCIAEGLVAEKFDAIFNDDYPLLEANVPLNVIKEICERTPGYITWQQEQWQSHCGTACIFHGDAEKEDLKQLTGKALDTFLKRQHLTQDIWQSVLENYNKGGSPALYKFQCSVCDDVVFSIDFD